MFLLFLVLSFLLIFLIIFGRSGSNADWRQALLGTSVIWSLLLLSITEILSAFDLLTRSGVVVGWAAVLAGSTILVLRGPTSPWFPRLPSLRAFSGLERIMLAGIGLIVLTTCVIALTAPPNTWDAMTYHMSRVMHWIQNHNVKHYPTNIGQQTFLPPMAEYVILHVQLLVGHDRFANMVQWCAMVGSAVGLSLIARELGGRLHAQLLASFLGATIPMGIFQSTSTQNDYFSSFWLIALSYYLLRLQKETIWRHAALSGISLGLAWLTKPTSYLYAAPFLIVSTFTMLRNSKLKGLNHLVLVAAIALFINLPHFARNVDEFGHPFGPTGYSRMNRNEIVTPASIASNLIRNFALHLATPWRTINQIGENAVDRIHSLLGMDANDGRTTFLATKFAIVFSTNEDSAGNPAQLILLFACGFLLYSLKQEGGAVRLCMIHFACVAVSFGLLCTFIRWNPWNSRYHLALFLLAAPGMAVVLEKKLSYNTLKWMVILLFFGSFPWVLYNFSKPVLTYPSSWKGNSFFPQVFEGGQNIFTISRRDQYFSINWKIRDSYIRAAAYLTEKGVKKVGIALGENDWEYPFFPLLQEETQGPIRIEHVLRETGSEKNEVRSADGFVPGAIISLTSNTGDVLQLGHTRFQKTKVFGPVKIFLPES